MDEEVKKSSEGFEEEFEPTYGTETAGLFIHEYLSKYKIASIYEIYKAWVKFRKKYGYVVPSYYSFSQNYIYRLKKLGKIDYYKEAENASTLKQIYIFTQDGKFVGTAYEMWRIRCSLMGVISPNEFIDELKNAIESNNYIVKYSTEYKDQFKTRYIIIKDPKLDDAWIHPQKTYRKKIKEMHEEKAKSLIGKSHNDDHSSISQ